MLRFQIQWFIYSFILSDSQLNELSHETGRKHAFTVHGAPRVLKSCIQWGSAWFPRVSFTTLLLLP